MLILVVDILLLKVDGLTLLHKDIDLFLGLAGMDTSSGIILLLDVFKYV